MSYILDALRKLEEKRQGPDASHGFLVSQASAPRLTQKLRSWHFALLAALLLNAGLLLWWLRPWQPPTHPPADIAESAPSARPPATPARMRQRERPAAQTIEESATARTAGGNSLRTGAAPPASPSPASQTGETGITDARPDTTAGGNSRVYRLDELPSSVRQAIPEISISGLFYSSDPSSRVVVINGRVAHEGAVISGSLALQRITPDGVIMSFEGYRFRRGMF
jgi:general secretion pathway protein B